MTQLKVSIPILNIRNQAPEVREDNYVGYLTGGTEFFADTKLTGQEISGISTWYKDQYNRFYWGGGVVEAGAAVVTAKKDWGFIDFKIDELWKVTKGEKVKVAILDTGLAFNHPEFINKTNLDYYNAITDSENPADCMDTDGHGTNCAGIIGARGHAAWGIAPDAALLIIKIRESSSGIINRHVIKGIEKAIAAGADVISLSFFLRKDEHLSTVHEKIKEAFTKNIVVVAAAGNSGGLQFPVDNFPASYPECLSAGGVNRSRFRSRFSTRSNFLKIMGPGEDLYSFATAHERINGTSFSTPFVAGVIALLISAAKINNRQVSVSTIFSLLQQTASQDIPGNVYTAIEYGWGILNPVKALNQLPLT